MDDTAQRVPGGVDVPEEACDRGGVGDVEGVRGHRGAEGGEPFEQGRALGSVDSPAADECQVPGAALGEVKGGPGAEAAESADDQVRAVRVGGLRGGAGADPDGFVEGDQDLADVLGVLQQAERLLDARGGVHLVQEGAVPPGAHAVGQRVQGARDGFRPEQHQAGEVDHVQGAVARQGPEQGPAVGVDVALAQLDEPPAAREDFHAAGQGLPAEGVEHDVDSAAAGDVAHPVGEGQVAGVEDVVRPQEVQQVPLGGRAGRRDDLRPGRPGVLEGGQPHAARSAVDEQGLARAQPGHVLQPVLDGEEGDGQGRGLGEGHAVGDRAYEGRVGAGVPGARGHQPENMVSDRESGDVGADGRDHARALEAQAVLGVDAVLGDRGQQTRDDQDITVVQRGGPHGDDHFARTGSGDGQLVPAEAVAESDGVDRQAVAVGARARAFIVATARLLGPWGPDDARDEASLAGEDDLVLVVRGGRPQFGQQPLGVRARVRPPVEGHALDGQ